MVNEQVKTSILMKCSRLHFATSAPVVWTDLGSASFLYCHWRVPVFRFARTIGANETKLSIDRFVKIDSFYC